MSPPGTIGTGQHVWPARHYSRITYVSRCIRNHLQNILNKGPPASGATFFLLEFLLALLVALLLELLALRKNGAIRSVGFRQRAGEQPTLAILWTPICKCT
jgi:hypothetical protein